MTQKVCQRVSKQKYIDLGIPGAYDKYNYETANLLAGTTNVIQGIELIAGGIQKALDPILVNGKGKSKYEKELDDIFALDDEDDAQPESSSSEFIDTDDKDQNTDDERLKSKSSLDSKKHSEQ